MPEFSWFSSALPYMLKKELGQLYSLFLDRSQLAMDDILAQRGIDRLLREHREGKSDHGNRLWLLVSSEVWYRMFIQGQSQQDLEDHIKETTDTCTAA